MTRQSTILKTCKCKYHEGERTISLSEFYLNKTKKDGFNSICKKCQKKINENNYKKNNQ